MVPESPLESTAHGLVPKGKGWFVLNAREAPWIERKGRGVYCEFEGLEGDEPDFSQLGINLTLLAPGEPMAMYHWEHDQEDFLVLAGEGLLIVEGQERPLRQWDLVHCPPGTNHVIIGAGERRPAWCLQSALATARQAPTGAPTRSTKRRYAGTPASSKTRPTRRRHTRDSPEGFLGATATAGFLDKREDAAAEENLRARLSAWRAVRLQPAS
jgi:quercetin dioxygenase-like cupin family protein